MKQATDEQLSDELQELFLENKEWLSQVLFVCQDLSILKHMLAEAKATPDTFAKIQSEIEAIEKGQKELCFSVKEHRDLLKDLIKEKRTSIPLRLLEQGYKIPENISAALEKIKLIRTELIAKVRYSTMLSNNQSIKSEFDTLLLAELPNLTDKAQMFLSDLQDINDLVQETVFKAIKYKQKFAHGTDFNAWLYVIMRNTFINNYRSQRIKQERITLVEDISTVPQVLNADYNLAERGFIRENFNSALSLLPATLREPLNLYLTGFHYREISKKLKLPIGTIKSRIFWARKNMKKFLSSYSHFTAA